MKWYLYVDLVITLGMIALLWGAFFNAFFHDLDLTELRELLLGGIDDDDITP